MKNWFNESKPIFTLLLIAAVVAIITGMYLGIALGMQVQASVTVLSGAGLVLWATAWIAFMNICLRLRRGESAFTPATGNALHLIGWCMVGLAVVTVASSLIAGSREVVGFQLIELVVLPCFFLGVTIVARILRGLLEHAMALEKEQEGVV